MMRDIKLKVLFEVHNSDFTVSIKEHFTTINMLMLGTDPLDYGISNVVATLQFTGIKDKNGSEIYEGDTLICNTDVEWIVVFKDGCFQAQDPEDAIDWVLLDDYNFEVKAGK